MPPWPNGPGLIGPIDNLLLLRSVQLARVAARRRQKRRLFRPGLRAQPARPPVHGPSFVEFLAANATLMPSLVFALPADALARDPDSLEGPVDRLVRLGARLALTGAHDLGALEIDRLTALGIRFVGVDARDLIAEAASGTDLPALKTALDRDAIDLIAEGIDRDETLVEIPRPSGRPGAEAPCSGTRSRCDDGGPTSCPAAWAHLPAGVTSLPHHGTRTRPYPPLDPSSHDCHSHRRRPRHPRAALRCVHTRPLGKSFTTAFARSRRFPPRSPGCRRRGKRVVMLSNAPRRVASVVAKLDEMGIDRSVWDHVMSSGEATYEALRDRSDPFHAGLGARASTTWGRSGTWTSTPGSTSPSSTRRKPPTGCCAPASTTRTETVEDHRADLEAARARDLPLVCANPDLIVVVGGHQSICAGMLAAVYEESGRHRGLARQAPCLGLPPLFRPAGRHRPSRASWRWGGLLPHRHRRGRTGGHRFAVRRGRDPCPGAGRPGRTNRPVPPRAPGPGGRPSPIGRQSPPCNGRRPCTPRPTPEVHGAPIPSALVAPGSVCAVRPQGGRGPVLDESRAIPELMASSVQEKNGASSKI